MPLPIRYALLTLAALTIAPPVALAGAAGPYLSWQGKSQAPAQTQSYNVPPSPYGQVGDPYRHSLTWPTKQQPQQQQASLQPPPRQPDPAPQPLVSVAVLRPMPRPEPVIVAPQPAPQQHVTPPAPQPSAMTSPAPAPAADTYQVPATSKYAARIASARAAQAQDDVEPQARPTQDAANPAGGAAPTPASNDTSLASQETDHVFIPGEQITDNVSQEPRRYSLHRQYGLHPDPIQVDRDATGALLETHFDALNTGDDDSTDTESGSDGGPTATP